jgi:hypothetical protein
MSDAISGMGITSDFALRASDFAFQATTDKTTDKTADRGKREENKWKVERGNNP